MNKADILARLFDKVAIDLLIGIVVNDNFEPCWIRFGWNTGNGYTKLSVDGRHVVAHKALWRVLHGSVCPTIQLDHLCRNRACINPLHLEPVFPVINTRRGEAVLFRKKAA